MENATIHKSQKEVDDLIINNIILMLSYRKVIDESKVSNIVQKLQNEISDYNVYSFEENGVVYIIKFYHYRISFTHKSSESIEKFLLNNKIFHKIVVLSEMKSIDRYNVMNNTAKYGETEIFSRDNLLMHLPHCNLFPKINTILTETEKEELIKQWKIKNYSCLPQIKWGDPNARLLNANVDDIIRSVYFNDNSSESPIYRLVVRVS